jgi:hypothetical protein
MGVAAHAATAAVFFFALQVWLLEASTETGLVWGLVGGVGAAYLAWSRRSG